MRSKRVYAGKRHGRVKRRKVFAVGNVFSRVPRGVRPELKCIDQNNAGASPFTVTATNAGAFYPLNFLIPGADVNNRVGRKITLKSVQIRLRFVPTGAAAINDLVRVMVVYDRQSNLGTPATSDLIQTIDSAGLTSSTVYDFKSISNEERFQVLQDRSFTFPQLGATLASNDYTNYSQNTMVTTFNKLNHLCSYGQGSNYPDTGTVWLFIQGALAVAIAPTACQWTSRVRYTDA